MRLAVIALAMMIATSAHAQSADVPQLIKLIDNQPSDMDRSTWKEKRRDAARKLAQSKDKRALPVLAKLAENETFDIIGEIAIEGLGTLGDPGAVPTLQKIVADPSRDKGQRDLARKSLAKLGASAEPTTTPPKTEPTPPKVEPTPPVSEPKTEETKLLSAPETHSTGGALVGEHSGAELPELPEVSDDTIAAYERLTFASGTASLGYDTGVKRLAFDADVAGSYEKRVEREANAYGFDASAHVVTGYIHQGTSDRYMMGGFSTRGAEIIAAGHGEARVYSGQLYGVGKLGIGYQMDYINDGAPSLNGQPNIAFTTTDIDLQVAVGGGYGRLLDVGGAIRVRRLARTLDAARALGKPIDAATAKKLQLAWWALRGERSTYRALVVTVAILREAGILLSEPDAGLSYELLDVLRDSWLYQRPSGLDVQVTVSEGYLARPDSNGMMPMYDDTQEQGRVEQLLAQAGYAAQLDDDKVELAGSAYARARLFGPDTQASPWGIGATASLRRFTYGDHGDPFGLFDLTGNIGLSDDGLSAALNNGMASQKSLHIEGDLGFTYWLNQAGGIRLAGTVIEDGGILFFGGKLEATYGLLDGTFAR